MWSITTFCVKVGQCVQKLNNHMACSFPQTFYPNPSYKINAQPIQLLMHHNLELLIQFQSSLLPPLPYALVLNHVFTCLPMTPLMLWRLHQMNKGGFRVVGNNVSWNALEIIKIDHKCNFNTIKNMDLKSSLFMLGLILNFIA